ncbi:hypothetical protein GCM10027341_47720 [Spirosoma knui]
MGLPAARINDPHVCPMSDGPKPHVGGTVLPPGVPTVLIGSMPAATLATPCLCASPAPNLIAKGSAGVFIGKKPAARQLDTTAHGGTIVMGLPTVLIGDSSMGPTRAVTLLPNGNIMFGPGIEIVPDPSNPDFQMQALQALIRLNTTPTMQRAFSAVEASGNKVVLQNYNDPNDPNNATTEYDNPSPGSSTIAWSPAMHGVPSSPGQPAPVAFQPGSDIVLGHEFIHATHNATGTVPNETPDSNGSAVSEERNTTGLPAQTYNEPGNPRNGEALPDTTGQPYTENKLRQDYANNGWPSPATGQPPVQRPAYSTSGQPF